MNLVLLDRLPSDATLPPSGPANPDPAIDAQNDREAIIAWLMAKAGRSVHTCDSYVREAARFLCWLAERGIALRDMKVEHAHEFFAHLACPPAHWLRPRRRLRQGETIARTQLLVQGLSNQSIDHARTVLGLMCAYLCDAGYLSANVFRLSMKPLVVKETVQTRLLDLDAWNWLWNWACTRRSGSAFGEAEVTRTRYLLALLYHTGIRREEVAHSMMGDFHRRDGGWSLRIIGKGEKERFVTVNSALLEELIRYRNANGLSDYPVPGEDRPLLGSLHATRSSQTLTPRSVGRAVAEIAQRASAESDDPHITAQLNAMSTHWMRHTNASMRFLAGASSESTMDELGHADMKSTRIYLHVADRRRRDDAEKLAALTRTRTS